VAELGIFVGFLLMLVVFGLSSKYFFTVENLLNIAKQSSIIAVIAFGMTLVIISGGIDLSVGSVVALSAVVMATLMKKGVAPVLAVALGFGVGIAAGLLNGVFISRVKLAPFIVTLGSMSYLRGLGLVFTKGMPVYGVAPGVRFIGNGSLWVVPIPVLIVLAMVVVSTFLLRRTRFGEYATAMGGNEEATRLSGVNVTRYKTLVYMFSGACSVLGAIILMARINAAEPIAGIGYELDAIAAAVMGGTSLSGGVGSMIGTVFGALVIAGLRNGLNILNVDANWQQVAIGVVIMLAVIIDRFRKK
jgi:ribose transport system permease protein